MQVARVEKSMPISFFLFFMYLKKTTNFVFKKFIFIYLFFVFITVLSPKADTHVTVSKGGRLSQLGTQHAVLYSII